MLNRFGLIAARYHRAVLIASVVFLVVVSILGMGRSSGCSQADRSMLLHPLLRPRRLLLPISVVNRAYSS
jgi:hypothetical protein